MLLRIRKINGVPEGHWKVRFFGVDAKSPVISDLKDLKKFQLHDFKKIIKAVRIASETPRGTPVKNEKLVSECATIKGVFEFRADKGDGARMMFFYLEAEGAIVCTNIFQKGGNQDAAFLKCSEIRNLILSRKYEFEDEEKP